MSQAKHKMVRKTFNPKTNNIIPRMVNRLGKPIQSKNLSGNETECWFTEEQWAFVETIMTGLEAEDEINEQFATNVSGRLS